MSDRVSRVTYLKTFKTLEISNPFLFAVNKERMREFVVFFHNFKLTIFKHRQVQKTPKIATVGLFLTDILMRNIFFYLRRVFSDISHPMIKIYIYNNNEGICGIIS